MFCLAIQLAAAGGLFCALPALVWRGGAGEEVVSVLCASVEAELETEGAVVGRAEDMEAPLELEEGSKMVTIPEEGRV